MAVFGQILFYSDEFSNCSSHTKEREIKMYNNRLLQVVAVVVVLMAVATNGVAAASAPTGPERNVASSQCPAILRQELGTVLPAGWSDYRESDCMTGGRQAGLATVASWRDAPGR